MNISTVRQNYVVLKAIEENPRLGVAGLVAKITSISESAFGKGAELVSNPAPLSDVLSELSEWGDVSVENGRFHLTEQGRKELANTEPLALGAA